MNETFKPLSEHFVLRLDHAEMEQVKQLAQADHRSINNWIREVILMAAERSLLASNPTVKVNVQPGEDIIVQRRNRAGQFIKKEHSR